MTSIPLDEPDRNAAAVKDTHVGEVMDTEEVACDRRLGPETVPLKGEVRMGKDKTWPRAAAAAAARGDDDEDDTEEEGYDWVHSMMFHGSW